MIKNSEFTTLLKSLAQRHRQILDTPQKRAFVKLILAADPIQKQVNLSSFYDKLKLSFGSAPFLVAMSYDTLHSDKGASQLAHRRAGFMVLAKAENNDTSRDAVLDRTEEIGYEVMAAFGEEFRGLAGRRAGRMLDYGSLAVDSIGPVGDMFCGTRFEFDFTEQATHSLTYDASKFLD